MMLVKKNPNLPQARNPPNHTPLHRAAQNAHKETVQYLLPVTDPSLLTEKDVQQSKNSTIELLVQWQTFREVRTIKQDFWCRFANAKGTAMVQVEKVVQLSYKEMQNKDRKSPRQVFTGKHENLVEKGDKWMKDTASSCATVAALVVTVVFAAAFTVPGGNNSDLGIPVYLKETSFMIFAVLDALGLFSSSTSLLMFLGILTSCYSEEDFLKALPMRLSIGLITLFFSIASMLTAFTAAFHLVLFHRVKWITIPIGLIASAPVTLFALL
ncbi:hypothetical protein GH714_005452 [Hevea brasiliensis]|uniref:PGG domain-containing protein n=1 Tax=Hevea brasiliensis TaxID=3981 RepID=A0A6A6N8M0_HEVBR|nr:hypothetical protein GH714_005452 [Hevea brasiliensis]